MRKEIIGMELKTAICPACKQQIKVDASETIDFCKKCGKPLNTKKAIEFYTDSVEQEKKRHKPSDQAIEKFNAILAQDSNLAEQYLEELQRKEYGGVYYSIDIENIFKTLETFDRIIKFKDKLDYLVEVKKKFEQISEINPHIGEMYRKLFCGYVNEQVKLKTNRTFTGELPYLKLIVGDINDWLDAVVSEMFEQSKKHTEFPSMHWRILSINTSKWSYPAQGNDDDYVLSLIENIYNYEHLTKNEEINSSYSNNIVCGYYISWVVERRKVKTNINNLSQLATNLSELLSPNGKQQFEKMSQEHDLQLKNEREIVYNVELAFWREYITLLETGKIKEAFNYITTNPLANSSLARYEQGLFKKGLFGMKYKGNIKLSDAEHTANFITDERLAYGQIPSVQKASSN